MYEWGQNKAYSDLPGFVKAAAVDELPKDVQFTDDAANSLFDADIKGLLNGVIARLLDVFYDWTHSFVAYLQVFERLCYSFARKS